MQHTRRSFLSTIAALAILALVPIRVLAFVDYYVDGQAGNDANNGTTTATPFKSIWGLQQSAFGTASGDRAFLSGTLRMTEAHVPGNGQIISHLQNCYIGQWSGMPPAILRGDIPVTWTATGTAGVYTYTVPDNTLAQGLTEGVASVVWDWDTSVDTLGRHYGHLKQLATVPVAAAGSTSACGWYFAKNGAGGGTITISVLAGDDPSTHVVAYCPGNINGLELGTPTYAFYPTWGAYDGTNNNGTIVEGLSFVLWADPGYRKNRDQASGQGDDGSAYGAGNPVGTVSISYGLRFADGVNCTIRQCNFWDCGYHPAGFVGDACRGNVIEDCVAWGGGANTQSGSSSFVFYSGPGLGTSYVSQCVGRRLVHHKYTFLGRDGKPIPFPYIGTDAGTTGAYYAGISGLLSHTNTGSSTNKVTDCQYEDCVIEESGDTSDNSKCVGSGFIGGSDSATPGNVLDWKTYPLRYVRCRLINGSENLSGGTCSVGYYQCRFEMPRAGQYGLSTASGANIGSLSGTNTFNYTSCEFVIGLDNTTAATTTAAFYATTTSASYFINSSVYVTGSSAPGGAGNVKGIFFTPNVSYTSKIFYSRGSVYGFQWCDSTTATSSGNKHLFYSARSAMGDRKPTGTIASHTAASPTVCTCVGHGLTNGQYVVVEGSTSTTSINGTYVATKIDNDTFSIPVNCTGAITGTATFHSNYLLDFDGNAYFNVTTNKYIAPYSGGTQNLGPEANFLHATYGTDRTGLSFGQDPSLSNLTAGYPLRNPFLEPDGRTLQLNRSARLRTLSNAVHAQFGINGVFVPGLQRAYSSNYGAWQYGPSLPFLATRLRPNPE